MDFYDVVASRRMVRDFTDQPVDEEALTRILTAGLMAPTNDHLRGWGFVVLTDEEIIGRVLKGMPKKMSEKRRDFILDSMRLKDDTQRAMYADAVPKQYAMLSTSRCLVLPLFRQKASLLSPRSLSSLNGFASIWCCIENMLLAAAAEGLGCALRIPMGKEAEQIQQVVGYPATHTLPCLLSIGHPAPEATVPAQVPASLAEKLHRNGW